MTREIKFRAWDNCPYYGKRMLPHEVIVRNCGQYLCSDSYTGRIIMQYTGLKDKNGVEIYEGDIVKWGVHHHLVKWADWLWSLCNRDKGADIPIGYMTHEENMEVIGNIHETPELLKHESGEA